MSIDMTSLPSPLKIFFSFLGFMLLLFIISPLLKMIASTDPHAAAVTIADTQVINSILLTLKAALYATILGIFFGIPFSYILARHNFFGKSIIEGIIDLPTMVPHTAAGIALLTVYGRGFFAGKFFANIGLPVAGHTTGIVIAMLFVSVPFFVNAAKDGFASVDPRLESVARTLGATPLQAFYQIALPLSSRNIISGAIMMWARGISEFGAVIILVYHPMTAPVVIYERFMAYGLKYAKPVAVLLVIICLILFAVLRGLNQRMGRRS